MLPLLFKLLELLPTNNDEPFEPFEVKWRCFSTTLSISKARNLFRLAIGHPDALFGQRKKKKISESNEYIYANIIVCLLKWQRIEKSRKKKRKGSFWREKSGKEWHTVSFNVCKSKCVIQCPLTQCVLSANPFSPNTTQLYISLFSAHNFIIFSFFFLGENMCVSYMVLLP